MTNEEAMAKLAEAMTKLADRLEKFQDPVLWQKIFRDAVSTGLMPPIQPLALPVALPVGRVESVNVSLSDEERTKLIEKLHEMIQPQITEFNDFVKKSLEEMPPGQLRDLAKKIETGEKPSLKRRHGCVFLSFDSGEDFYLGL